MGVAARIAVGIVLVGAALGSSFLALVFTGGDSAFGSMSRWVYAPWLAALALTLVALGALSLAGGRTAAGLAAAALLAYLVTAAVWMAAAG